MAKGSALLVEGGLAAVWLGAAALFAAVVAPAAFAVLPTRALAGALVGRILPVLFYVGMLLGAVVVLLESQRIPGSRGRQLSGAVVFAACVVAQFVIGRRIESLRQNIGGALDALPVDDARRSAFGRLHGASVGLLGVAMLAAVVIAVLAARSDDSL